jgi:hypothetical protein
LISGTRKNSAQVLISFSEKSSANTWDIDASNYTPLEIKRSTHELNIFVEWEKDVPKLTTKVRGNEGINDIIGQFDVEQLPFGFRDRVHRLCVGSSILYVQNIALS